MQHNEFPIPHPILKFNYFEVTARNFFRKIHRKKTILFNLCGHGHFDMAAYDDYFNDRLAEDVYEEELVNSALSDLPEVS